MYEVAQEVMGILELRRIEYPPGNGWNLLTSSDFKYFVQNTLGSHGKSWEPFCVRFETISYKIAQEIMGID